MATERRLQRINEFLKRELALLIDREMNFEAGTLVTVTRARANNTLFSATIYVSVLPDEKAPAALKLLERHTYELQQILNKDARMRPVPRIVFEFDKGQAQAEEVYKKIEEIHHN